VVKKKTATDIFQHFTAKSASAALTAVTALTPVKFVSGVVEYSFYIVKSLLMCQ